MQGVRRCVEVGSEDGGGGPKFLIWHWSMFCAQRDQKDLRILAFWLANTTALSLHLRQYTGDNQVRAVIITCIMIHETSLITLHQHST